MGEGIYYRLGILTGRLKGYENDEDLLKLIKKYGYGSKNKRARWFS